MMKTINIIPTQFASVVDKAQLIKKIEAGDKDAMSKILSEIDRLESIIRDYEMLFNLVNVRQETRTFKKSYI